MSPYYLEPIDLKGMELTKFFVKISGDTCGVAHVGSENIQFYYGGKTKDFATWKKLFAFCKKQGL